MKWSLGISEKISKWTLSTDQPNLFVKVFVGFCLTIILAAVVVNVMLFRVTLNESTSHLAEIAGSASRLVILLSENDRIPNEGDARENLQKTYASNIAKAFSGASGVGRSEEILIIRDGGNDEGILAQEITLKDGQQQEKTIASESAYGRLMLKALAGASGNEQVADNQGRMLLVAYEPVMGTPYAIVVSRQLSEFLLPLYQGISAEVLIVLLIIVPAIIFGYKTAMFMSMRMRSAEKKAEELRTESEARKKFYGEALNLLSEGVVYYDAEDRLVLSNTSFHNFYKTHENALKPGNKYEEILREGVAVGAFPDATGNEEEWIHEQLARHGENVSAERHLVGGRWLKISENRTANGGIIGVHTDITVLKNRELKLRESENKFKDYVDTASDWFWETGPDHRFIHLNLGNRPVTEHDSFFVMGKRRIEFADEDICNEKWRSHIADLNAHRPFYNFRYWMKYPGAPKIFVSISGKPHYDDNGNFLGYRGTGRDMTSEKEAYEKLNLAEQTLRLAFQNVTVGIVVADEKGTITAFNKEASRMFGYSPDEAIGRNVSMLASGEDSVNHDKYIQRFLETGEARIIGRGREVDAARKNGEIFPIHLGIAHIKIDGKSSFIASTADLSDQKIMEQKLRHSKKMEAVGKLVGGIAHDFNNLLGIIIGNLDLICSMTDPESPPAKQAEKALNAATRGATLTRRLLNFSRQAPMEFSPVDVNATLRNLQELLQKSLTGLVDVVLVLDDDIPYALTEQGDLEDAITNICVNARDAMPDGGKIIIKTRCIEIDEYTDADLRELQPGQYIELDVTDNGVGMPASVREHIFEPFFSTKEKNKGTGLGLSMVYGFAKRCGGLVVADSVPGQGSTFRIFLPVAKEDQVPGPELVKSEFDISQLHGTETILIVDDEEDLLNLATRTLSDLGYLVLTANDGAQAIEVLQTNPTVDLVLTDVVMPGGVSGYQLAKKIHASYPKIKICLTSGYSDPMKEPDGVPDFDLRMIRKPYLNTELAKFIRVNLDADDAA